MNKIAFPALETVDPTNLLEVTLIIASSPKSSLTRWQHNAVAKICVLVKEHVKQTDVHVNNRNSLVAQSVGHLKRKIYNNV